MFLLSHYGILKEKLPYLYFFHIGGYMEQNTKELLQWHPAFYAGLQIELAEEADKLIFENEHTLSNKPMLIDVLIIKKNSEEPIQKNIGKIFQKYNIIEYKSPTDYLSIDDFYKVYGYTCFYKSDANKVNAIPIQEITITFASHNYPRDMINHLKEVHGYEIEQKESGIYYILGDIIPIQLLVTSRLSKEQNLWLNSLTNCIKDKEQISAIIKDYQKHKNNALYDAVLNLIIQANQKTFKEGNPMCEALEDLMKDIIKEKEQTAEQRGIQLGEQQGKQQQLLQQIQKKINKSKTIEQIAEELEETIETISPLYYQLKANH